MWFALDVLTVVKIRVVVVSVNSVPFWCIGKYEFFGGT